MSAQDTATAKVMTGTDVQEVLNYLPYFLAVARAGSVTQAAHQLHRAASAITRAIAQMENCLGTALFERKPRGMLLNVFGEVVLQRALRVQEEMQSAADEFWRTHNGARARLAVQQHNAFIDMLYSSRKLQLLVYLSELRNLSAAATRMHLSQAGASMALARIESLLGQALFQRMLQGMVPTDGAARLILRVKRILAEMRQMDADLSALTGDLSGVVTIGVLPLGRTYVVPTAIAAVVNQYHRIRVVTVENAYEQLVTQLRCGDIDVLFGALRDHEDCQGLATEMLFDDRMGIVVRAGHALAQAPGLALQALLGEQWILPKPLAPGRRLIDSSFKALGLTPPVATVETSDLAVMRQLLCCSDLLTAISPQQLMFEIQAGLLVELPVSVGSTTRQIGLTVRAGALLSPATHALLAAIRTTARQLPWV